MKRAVFTVGLGIMVFGLIILAQTQARSVEQALIKLEKEWYDAEVKKDEAFFDRIMADDFIGTGSAGNVYNKAQDIANLKSSADMIASVVSDEFIVRIYEDAAVVTFRSTEKGQSKGKAYSDEYRWTDTWIKKDVRWQCVASHCSKIVQK